MKTGIVMEGGAMRGMFTCGVLDVLMEEGITFDLPARYSVPTLNPAKSVGVLDITRSTVLTRDITAFPHL